MLKLSKESSKLFEETKKIALALGHSFVGTEHLLVALSYSENTKEIVLEGSLFGYKEILNEVVELRGRGENQVLTGECFSPNLVRVIEKSYIVAFSKKSREISPTHIALSLVSEKTCTAKIILNKIRGNGLKIGFAKNTKALNFDTLKTLRQMTPILNNFSKDLTLLALENKLDKVVGRENEIERLIQILLRKNKNNPCLIGYPGVGKSAVVDALAMRITKGEIPESLCEKRVVSLEIATLLSGAKYRGDFEERIKSITEEVKKAGNVILMIDEIHNIVNTGTGEGSLDAGNILKPELARGEISIIGATTAEEYRRYIEKDSALDRRFQKIMINEPSPEETISILRRTKDAYEDFHGIKITDDAIFEAVDLSVKKIQNRFLPDKAIDLIDEASARAKMEKHPVVDKSSITRALSYIIDDRLKSTQTHTEIKSELKNAIIGQEKQIDKTVNLFMRRKRKGEVLSVLFSGQSGCGKTLLAKEISKILFGENALLKLDMGEYSEKHSVSKLLGAPPGYVGYDEGGLLISEMTKNPNRVVLFDEIEKAHPEVLKVLLNLLDDGVIRDTRGRSVSFKNSFIIMTSSYGHERGARSSGFVLSEKEDATPQITKILGKELCARIDEIVTFDRANRGCALKIIEKLTENTKRILLLEGINVIFETSAGEYVLDKADITNLGYRNVEKTYFVEVENKIFAFIDECESKVEEIIVSIDDKKELKINPRFKKINLENIELSMYNKQKYID